KPRQRITGATQQLCTLPLARRRSCRKTAGASAQLCARNPARWPAPGEAATAHHRGHATALYPAAGAAAQLPENCGGISAAVRPEPGAMDAYH
ncbi:hypothetical protein, partial [Citrobacter portucalensis]|uniref:hypothetical protein n=1 Tax=Citrobacter portucalensis TaxID=1639133 RepID=UPI0033152994